MDYLESAVEARQIATLKKRMKPLQDDLGQMNDVRTAYSLIAPMTEASNGHGNDVALAAGIVLGWHERDLADREAKIARHVRRLRRARP